MCGKRKQPFCEHKNKSGRSGVRQCAGTQVLCIGVPNMQRHDLATPPNCREAYLYADAALLAGVGRAGART